MFQRTVLCVSIQTVAEVIMAVQVVNLMLKLKKLQSKDFGTGLQIIENKKFDFLKKICYNICMN